MRKFAVCLLLLLLFAPAAHAGTLAEVWPDAPEVLPETPEAPAESAPAANLWLLRIITQTDDVYNEAEHWLNLDYTEGGVAYTLEEPYLPLRLLAEAGGVPLYWRNINGQSAVLWAEEKTARLFLASRPEVWHIVRQGESWQAVGEVQVEQPRLLEGSFFIPISYLECFGFTYEVDAAAQTVTVYLPATAAAEGTALWAAAEPELQKLLTPPVTLLAEAVTSFDPKNLNRSQNLLLAASALHGLVIEPGGDFSFNRAVGKRSAARGYRMAIVFEDGEQVPGLGGGVCQVSSTVYQAARKAGMTITERHPHSLPVTYAKAGNDATVAWGAKDLRWRNDTKSPVQLACHIKDGKLSVQIFRLDDPAAAGRFLGNVAE